MFGLDNGCNQAPAWQLNGNSVVSGKGHADWVYLVMTLTVNGFRGRGGIVNGELLEVGRLSFSFEIQCAHDCELILMQVIRTEKFSTAQSKDPIAVLKRIACVLQIARAQVARMPRLFNAGTVPRDDKNLCTQSFVMTPTASAGPSKR